MKPSTHTRCMECLNLGRGFKVTNPTHLSPHMYSPCYTLYAPHPPLLPVYGSLFRTYQCQKKLYIYIKRPPLVCKSIYHGLHCHGLILRGKANVYRPTIKYCTVFALTNIADHRQICAWILLLTFLINLFEIYKNCARTMLD